MSEASISLRGIRKLFRSGSSWVEALSGIDLDVEAGSIVTLVGASGCGKSTLLRIIAGLEQATAGQVTAGSRIVDRPGPDRAVVFQSYSLYPWLSVAENIAFSARLAVNKRRASSAGSHTMDRAKALLHLVGLEKFAAAFPSQLSGGMQQRVAIARALMTQPPILLMDEPFGALDAQMRELMQELLLNIHAQEGMTIVFVTHDVEEAIYLGDRVVVLAPAPGRIDSIHETPPRAARSHDVVVDTATLDLQQVVRRRIRETSTLTIDEGLMASLGKRTAPQPGPRKP